MKNIFIKLKCLFGIHEYLTNQCNSGYYDEEIWLECKHCGKQIN